MSKYITKVIIALVIAIITMSSISVHADEMDIFEFNEKISNQKNEIKEEIEIEEEYEIDTLYVLNEKDYNEALLQNVLIVKDKDLFLIIKNDITQDDRDILNKARVFYIFGEYNDELEKLTAKPNYGGNLFGYNMYESAAATALEKGTDKDLIIVNGQSFADSLTAAQLSIKENKNILIVEEEGIPRHTGEYLAEFGEDLTLSFVEGELSIDDSQKKQLLAIAGNEKYELDKTQYYREISKEEAELAKHVMLKYYEDKVQREVDTNPKAVKTLQESAKNFISLNSERLIDSTSLKIASDKKVISDLSNMQNELNDIKVVKNDSEFNSQRGAHSILIIEAKPFEGRESNLEVITIERPKPKIKDIGELQQIFINQILEYKGWEYSQERRWEDGYQDCSSLVERGMLDSGITDYSTNLVVSKIQGDPRFQEIPWDYMQPGDLLVHEGHVEVYMGGDTTYGSFQPGMTTGYSYQISRFDQVFRLTGK